MEGALKVARHVSTKFVVSMVVLRRFFLQYWYEQNQPQRKNFISRELSYHGNTVAALSLSGHPSRRAPYIEILQHDNYHKVSPAYAKRFQKADETEEQYVERLRQELEDKIVELGPDTVIGCRSPHLLAASNELILSYSRCRNRGWSDNWRGSCTKRLLQSYEVGLQEVRSPVYVR